MASSGPIASKGLIRHGLIAWIVVGAIAGFLATQITGSREGLLMMVVLGVVGGLVGGFVATSILKIGGSTGSISAASSSPRSERSPSSSSPAS